MKSGNTAEAHSSASRRLQFSHAPPIRADGSPPLRDGLLLLPGMLLFCAPHACRRDAPACGTCTGTGGHAPAWGGECATTGVYAPAQGADCFQTATEAPPASPSSKGPPPTLLSPRRNGHVFCRKDPAELPCPLDPRHQGCSGAHHPCSAALLPWGFFTGAFISDFYICYLPPSHTSHQPREPNLLRASPPSAAKVWAVLPKQGGRSRSPHTWSWGSPLLHCTTPLQALKSPLLRLGAERGCVLCSAVTPGSKGILGRYSCCLSWVGSAKLCAKRPLDSRA